MSEVTQNAYIALRTYITSSWKTVSLRNDQNIEIKKLTLDGTKVKWTHSKETKEEYVGDDKYGDPVYRQAEYESNQTLELTITLKGSDFTLPKTVSRSVIIDSGENEVSAENFQPFTFENANDELTIKHKIQVPAIA
ncbi:hypothetical protein [Heyndrickxia sporothermodurans]|uniref:Uncharacterized protein n=1 Tax=Heyndrickxia sporothermodurans TaxID=46224 RepID=A0AB37H8C5_9BACI|nr:hypothetical protein [Heyndrickxia sporothermodurans]MBL5769286.1 hypothetical protein [Heyndrickxia sporothermodurans]MBL5773064.1 hypothetical protein [Heyndrickxia sporothermodurans]MBL5776557.1 hypothetical protein [Heyndrickxia sporothermodurans]MBL5783661.1 hypothetical protein [Heyndrickxia sporothermodurans]MBL5787160.1 hypothetical protein [Heyndrickxia sporothermodurans]